MVEDDRPSLNFDKQGYIYHLNDDSAAADNGDAHVPYDMSIHSDPFGTPLVHFTSLMLSVIMTPPSMTSSLPILMMALPTMHLSHHSSPPPMDRHHMNMQSVYSP
jgi:hypothetical protein